MTQELDAVDIVAVQRRCGVHAARVHVEDSSRLVSQLTWHGARNIRTPRDAKLSRHKN
jgi:hypothetical protein